MSLIKEIFTLSKQDIMYLIIGAFFVIIIIKRIIPIIKDISDKKKDFYDNINSRFDKLEIGIDKIMKGLNIAYEILINQLIDEYHSKGVKSHFADEKFTRLINKYEEYGNGNSESMKKQWGDIPFE